MDFYLLSQDPNYEGRLKLPQISLNTAQLSTRSQTINRERGKQQEIGVIYWKQEKKISIKINQGRNTEMEQINMIMINVNKNWTAI